MELIEATCSLSWAQVVVGEAQFDEMGERRQTVLVTVAEVPPGTHHGSVVVRTNVPEYAELRVPLRIEGPLPMKKDD